MSVKPRGELIDTVGANLLARQRARRVAEEAGWQLAAAAGAIGSREAELQPLLGGGDAERELKRLESAPRARNGSRSLFELSSASRSSSSSSGSCARRRRKRPLDEADDRRGPEAQPAQRVHIQHVHPATRERALALIEDIVDAQPVYRRPDRIEEALRRHRLAERVEIGERRECADETVRIGR